MASRTKKTTSLQDLSEHVHNISDQELRELVIVNSYKPALAKSQLDVVLDLLIRHRVTTYEEVWKLTKERLHDDGFPQESSQRKKPAPSQKKTPAKRPARRR